MLFGSNSNRSIFDRVKNFPILTNLQTREPENAPSFAAQYIAMEPFGSTPRAKAKELADLYNKSPWVRSIVGKIATSVACQKWYFENANGERIDRHPALDFLKAGSPLLRGKNALKVSSAIYDLQGEVFWIIGRDARGVPVQWAPIPSNWVIDTPTVSFMGFRVQSRPGHVVELQVRDVMWLRDPDPTDPYTRGSALTGAAQTEIGADEAAADMLAAFFKNRARPDIIVTGTEKNPIRDQDRAPFEASWLEKFRGVGKAFRPFFSASEIHVHELGSGLKDVETAEIREMGRKVIQEFYGVPPEIFGRLENSNKATVTEARNLFGRYTLDPRLSFIRDEVEPWLAEEFNTAGLTLCYESPIEEDTEFALKVMQAFPADFTRNEKRKLAKCKAADDGDELFDQIDPNDIGDEDPDGPGGGNEKPSEDDKPDDSEKAVDVVAVAKSVNIEDVINVSAAHEDPQVRAEATKLIDELFVELIQKFGSELLEELAAEANFQAAGRVAEFIAEEVPGLLGRVDETTRKELRASLAEGVAKNEAVADLVKRVDAVFEEASKIRASMIGDTVATKITGFASQVAAEEAGFGRKKWLSTRDQLVRGTHASLDGQVVPVNGKFKSESGATAPHPGAFGTASEDINCRCAMRPVIDGEERAISNDADFVAFHTKAWNRTGKRVRNRFKDIFAAQREVVVAALERANRT